MIAAEAEPRILMIGDVRTTIVASACATPNGMPHSVVRSEWLAVVVVVVVGCCCCCCCCCYGRCNCCYCRPYLSVWFKSVIIQDNLMCYFVFSWTGGLLLFGCCRCRCRCRARCGDFLLTTFAPPPQSATSFLLLLPGGRGCWLPNFS